MRSAAHKPWIPALLVALQLAASSSLMALPTPSKTSPEQSLAGRQIELARVQAVLSEPRVADALAQHGFSSDQVHERLAQLSPEQIHALSLQLDQLQAAGANVPQYIWILLAVLLGVLIVSALF